MLVYLLSPARQVIVADQLHKFPLLGSLGEMPAVQYPIQRPPDFLGRDGNSDLCQGLMFGIGSLIHRASHRKSTTKKRRARKMVENRGSRIKDRVIASELILDLRSPIFNPLPSIFFVILGMKAVKDSMDKYVHLRSNPTPEIK
jgi:hypothetical protein